MTRGDSGRTSRRTAVLTAVVAAAIVAVAVLVLVHDTSEDDPPSTTGSPAASATGPAGTPGWDYGPVPAPAVGEQPTSFRSAAEITPVPLEAPEDVPDLYAEGCQTAEESTEIDVCSYGDADADLTVAVVGDSKAAQWVPALQVLAAQKGWKVRTYTKSACPFAGATVTQDGVPYEECRTWGARVLQRLTGRDKPDVVLTASLRRTAMVGDDPAENSRAALEKGMRSYWKRLEGAGVAVVGLADTPRTGFDVYSCVATHLDDVTPCSYDRADGIGSSGLPVQREAAERAGIPFVDLTDYVCPVGPRCPPVIDGLLVYRQGTHLTKTYVESLAPVLGSALDDAFSYAGVPAS